MAVASQAAISIENARLYSELAEERDRILDVEQEVRNQLARDLHDGPAQLLASLIMRLRLGLRLLDQGRAEARAELAALEPLLERTLREVRTMLFDLRPVILEARGLVAAVEEYARRQREEGFDVRLSVKGESRRLRQNSERAIFAIVQEAISNSRKHSGADGAVIRLNFEEGRLSVEVHDDGAGFDLQAVEASYATRGSLGLLNMRERAQAIGGQLVLTSEPGQGTSLCLTVPG
jgi:signal transduction histidine kinase